LTDLCYPLRCQTVATECQGDGDLLQSLAIKNVKTGETSTLDVNGLFYAIGHEPATLLVRDQVHTDDDGYIVTVPGTAQTSIKGVFAAGDVQDKKYRQAITSAGSGKPELSVHLNSDRLFSACDS
jgi:thioredoxin reductase (NADPH)